jgi:hypothetical protein
MNKAMKWAGAGLSMLALANCATRPENVDAKYVSPVGYQNWTCPQLIEERHRLTREVQRVSGLQRENANADAAMMTVGVVLFWPMLFGLAATRDRKEELGRLKGEYDAVNEAARIKACPVPPPGPTAPQPPPTNMEKVSQAPR